MSANKGEYRCDGTTLHYPWWRIKLLVDVLAEDETAVDYLLAQWGIDGEGMDYPSKVKHLARAALEEARSRQREIKRKDALVWLGEEPHPPAPSPARRGGEKKVRTEDYRRRG